ncbi:hypothetical protein FRAAL1578 [Frankia alni ACN14a]|uniref:Uncharacterized protein n=1 Tax=Frankia alni (strain DSM 45986 / CECT 9034 / ACN14a) TaxID=326424 RepID=Q0RQE2_FRAAA|nr:hypothetical protein FRAAL1578 [Frankia alni ACN14a]
MHDSHQAQDHTATACSGAVLAGDGPVNDGRDGDGQAADSTRVVPSDGEGTRSAGAAPAAGQRAVRPGAPSGPPPPAESFRPSGPPPPAESFRPVRPMDAAGSGPHDRPVAPTTSTAAVRRRGEAAPGWADPEDGTDGTDGTMIIDRGGVAAAGQPLAGFDPTRGSAARLPAARLPAARESAARESAARLPAVRAPAVRVRAAWPCSDCLRPVRLRAAACP